MIAELTKAAIEGLKAAGWTVYRPEMSVPDGWAEVECQNPATRNYARVKFVAVDGLLFKVDNDTSFGKAFGIGRTERDQVFVIVCKAVAAFHES